MPRSAAACGSRAISQSSGGSEQAGKQIHSPVAFRQSHDGSVVIADAIARARREDGAGLFEGSALRLAHVPDSVLLLAAVQLSVGFCNAQFRVINHAPVREV